MTFLKNKSLQEHNKQQLKFTDVCKCDDFCCNKIKGTVPRNFRLHVFYMNQLPPSPLVFSKGRFEFFRKFAKISVVDSGGK